MAANGVAKPAINAANKITTKVDKKEYRLVVAPPSMRPGGFMPPPLSKNGVDGSGTQEEEFTFNSLVSSISQLSPWAEVRSISHALTQRNAAYEPVAALIP